MQRPTIRARSNVVITTLKKGRDISAVNEMGRGRARVHILAYHAIADLSDDRMLAEYAVPPALFAEHLDTLAGAGWNFVDVETALRGIEGTRPLPPRALLLTFDDAYTDLLDVACPMLADRGLPGLVFAVADRIGDVNAWDVAKGATRLPLLDGEGLQAVAAQGVEVGSHTATHRSLTKISAAELGAELVGSANSIEALGLPRPRTFSYPYGGWSASIAAAVRDAGYGAAFTVDWGAASPGADMFSLPRVEVHASDTPRKLRQKLALATAPGLVRDSVLTLLGVRLDPSAR